MTLRTPLLGFVALLAVADISRAAQREGERGLDVLLNPPALTHVQLAPDGARLAMIQNLPERSGNLLVADIDKGSVIRMGSGDGFEVYNFDWTGSDGILFKVAKQIWNSGYDAGLYHTSVKKLRANHPLDSGSRIDVVGLPRGRPDRVIAWVKASAPSSSDQGMQHLGVVEYSLGLSSAPAFGRKPNSRTIVHTYPAVPGAELVAVHPDREGELGWCTTFTGGKLSAHLWDNQSYAWRALPLDLDTVTPLELDFDRRTLWCSRNLPEGGSELIPFDCREMTFGGPRLRDAAHRIVRAKLFFSRVDNALAGLSYARVRRHTVWFLPRFSEWEKSVRQTYPGMDAAVVGISDDERRLVFLLSAPDHPSLYVMLDTTKSEIRPIGSRNEGLDARRLSPAKLVRLLSRDGRPLFAWLTLPATSPAPAGPHPLVVLIGPGAHSDTTWGYDADVQWLAAQGYAVLQPGFLPSDSPGRAIFGVLQPGVRQVGDDVVDQVRGLAKDGLVNAGRIYLVGEGASASLALHLSFAEPRMFRGVAAINGIYDWPAWMAQLDEWRSYSPGERLMGRHVIERAVPGDFPYAGASGASESRLFIAAERDRMAFLHKQAAVFAKKRAVSTQFVQTYFRDAFFREEFAHPAKNEYYSALVAFLSESEGARAK